MTPAPAPKLLEWPIRKPLAPVPTAGTQSSRVRDIGLPDSIRAALPNDSKIQWIVQTVSASDQAEMATDLLRASTEACRTGRLWELAEVVLSWEATAEETEDSRSGAGISGEGRVEEPVDLDELRRRLKANS